MQQGEDGRNEEERRHGGDQESADDGAAEGRVLLAALVKREHHRQHADDHGERGHEDRTKPSVARLQRRCRRVQFPQQTFAGETDEQNAVCSCDAHAHDPAGESGNRQRRPGREQHPDDAGERAGQRGDDDEGVEPRLEIDDDDQIDEHDRPSETEIKLTVRAGHGLNLSAQPDIGPVRQIFGRLLQEAFDVRGDPAEIAPLKGGVNVDHRLDVVMRDDARARPRT
jgi:hypothetical protein